MENEIIEIFCLLKSIKFSLENIEKKLNEIKPKIGKIYGKTKQVEQSIVLSEDYD